MPVSIHVLLVHSSSYLKMIDMPISDMTEQCVESGNKISRDVRLHHTRKVSRVATMTDHFNRLMEISDPLATKLHERRQARVKKEKVNGLPQKGMELLVGYAEELEESGIAD